MGTVEKTPYERDQDAKVTMLAILAWICLLVWAWARAFEVEVPALDWHFWLTFGLLWGPLSWIVIGVTKANDDE